MNLKTLFIVLHAVVFMGVFAQEEQASYMASRTIKSDLIHTELWINFDWAQSQANGKVLLTMSPRFYNQSEVEIDAKGMEIHSVKLQEGSLKDVDFIYENNMIVAQLGKEYSKSDTFRIEVTYTSKPNEWTVGGSSAITSDKGLYFINPTGEEEGKMPQIWTQGETEANSIWMPTIDAPNAKTSVDFHITVENKYMSLSNGVLVKSTQNNDGTRTDHWRQTDPHAPYLCMMAIGEFVKVSDSWTRKDGSTMEVNYWVEPEWEESARAIFGATPEMIGFFSDILGVEYPWAKYDQIVVRDYVSGAMENTTAVIHGDFLYRDERQLLDSDNESIIAHELFHHWFGDLVTCESWPNLPLNESFANYSQYLWDEYKYGRKVADYNGLEEELGYLGQLDRSGPRKMIRFNVEHREDMFDANSYNKGGRILHMLRYYLGDEAFFAGLKNYLNKNAYTAAEIHELRLAFEEVTGEDLNWFFNQWFLDQGIPKVSVSMRYKGSAGGYVVMVKQKQDFETTPLYKLPVDIDFHYKDGNKVRKRIWITKESEEIIVPLDGKPELAIFDPERTLLAEKTIMLPKKTALKLFNTTESFRVKYDLLADIEDKVNNEKKLSSEEEQLILAALKDEFWGIKEMGIALYIGLMDSDVEDEAKEVVKEIALTEEKTIIRADAIELALDVLDSEDLDEIVEQGMESRSIAILKACVPYLADKDPERAMQIANDFLKSGKQYGAIVAAEILLSNGTYEDLPKIREVFAKMSTWEKARLFYEGTYSGFARSNALPADEVVKDVQFLLEADQEILKMFAIYVMYGHATFMMSSSNQINQEQGEKLQAEMQRLFKTLSKDTQAKLKQNIPGL